MRPRGDWVGVKESDDKPEVLPSETGSSDVVDPTAFESALEPIPDRVGEASPAPRKIDHNGKLVSLEGATKEIFSGTSKKYSTDRTRRVANMEKTSSSSGATSVIDTAVPTVHANLDPIVATVLAKGVTTLVVVQATSFELGNGQKMLTEIPLQ